MVPKTRFSDHRSSKLSHLAKQVGGEWAVAGPATTSATPSGAAEIKLSAPGTRAISPVSDEYESLARHVDA